jgi:hypothetical protein
VLFRAAASDFTRLKLVKSKKELEQKAEALKKAAEPKNVFDGKENIEDITAAFDANDDADVVF